MLGDLALLVGERPGVDRLRIENFPQLGLELGAVAYVLRRPLVLGRMFDEFLRNALIISGGSLAPRRLPIACWRA